MSELDFSTLHYNIHGAKKPVIELYPNIKQYPELVSPGISDKLLRYIIYLYSEGSPLIKKFKDNLVERKSEAMKLAGMKLTEDTKTCYFDFKDPEFTSAVVRFLTIQKNGLWSNIVTNEQLQSENMAIVIGATMLTDDKKIAETAKLKSTLLDINGQITDRLNGYYKEFFKSDTALQNAAKSVELKLTTPEMIATISRDF